MIAINLQLETRGVCIVLFFIMDWFNFSPSTKLEIKK